MEVSLTETERCMFQYFSCDISICTTVLRFLGVQRIAFKDFLINETIYDSGDDKKVFLATHVATKRVYALKQELDGDFPMSLTHGLCHPNLVQVYNTFTRGRFTYTVMEYIDGLDLWEMYDHQFRFSHATIVHWVKQLVLVVKYLHSKDIIHRDIKLENIMIQHNDVKLIDLEFDHCTIACVAPEIAKTRIPTKAMDWWAVGIVILELYQGPNNHQMLDENDVEFGLISLLPKHARHIASGLLDVDPVKRDEFANTVLKHPFFT